MRHCLPYLYGVTPPPPQLSGFAISRRDPMSQTRLDYPHLRPGLSKFDRSIVLPDVRGADASRCRRIRHQAVKGRSGEAALADRSARAHHGSWARRHPNVGGDRHAPSARPRAAAAGVPQESGQAGWPSQRHWWRYARDALAIAFASGASTRPQTTQLYRDEESSQYRCGARAGNQLDVFITRHRVNCSPISLSRYRRTVATRRVGGVDLGEWLVRNALALDWPDYSQGRYGGGSTRCRTGRPRRR